MILYRWRGPFSNFGDELNTLLWPALLSRFFDDDSAQRFLGIGSVLDCRHPAEVMKLVAGSGYGGYEPKPRLDETFRIAWVRGPRTAAAVGLPASLAVGDPAALVPATLGITASGGSAIGFMPHFESAARGNWRDVADLAGVRLLDPREPPLRLLHALAGCRLVISEALHGVIVADAMRIPWVALRPQAALHRAKWQDWGDAAGVTIRFHRLPASSMPEWVAAHLPGRWNTIQRRAARLQPALQRLWPRRMVDAAAAALVATANARCHLSPDAAHDRCVSRMLDAVHQLRIGGGFRPAVDAPRRSRLQRPMESAYQLKDA